MQFCLQPMYMHIHFLQPQNRTVNISEEQEKLLDEALSVVRKSSFEMKQCLVRKDNETSGN